MDEAIGTLFDRLVSLGLYDNTMIVLTSDHGEYFGEHGLVGHSKDVYQDTVSIPLIIKNFNQKNGVVIDDMASLVDVPNLIISELPHTIADQIGYDFPYVFKKHLIISETYYTPNNIVKRFNRVRTAVYEWPFKYIHSSDGEHELYNLLEDPQELNNIIDAHSDMVVRLKQQLSYKQSTNIKTPLTIELPQFSDKITDKLKALGYIQ